MFSEHGPRHPWCQEAHAEKYRGPGESFREAMNRVASSLQDGAEHYQAFRELLLDMRFLPAGRVQSAMGSTKNVTPYNCFVSGTIEDSFVEGSGSIMDRAKEAAATMRMGGGIGYDFSSLRPRGATIKKLASSSSGPVMFMEIYNSVCQCVASSGHRRGAQMGVMRVDHPDVEEFIRAKQNRDRLRGFNVSVAVTDEFMNHLISRKPFPLRFGREIYREVNARSLWEILMRSTWDWAEPGVLFIDAINRENNLSYCETIAATNPCGEQPLPPFGACLLGSFNLVRYVRQRGEEMWLDYAQLRRDIPLVVRAMDNVVDRATYPLWEQEREAKGKRRMGLGVTGLANTLEALGKPYASIEFIDEMRQILTVLRDVAYMASTELAAEKGPFEKYDPAYLRSPFIERLPGHIRQAIRDHGIRNSHLLSIAPTGTISLVADNVSSGIEPVAGYSVDRQVILGDGVPRTVRLQDYGVEYFGVRGRRCSEVSAQEHVEVLAAAQPLVDSSISKTCNVPSDMPWEDFSQIYVNAWRWGAKGCTTYRAGGMREAILTESSEGSSCSFDPATGRVDCEG